MLGPKLVALDLLAAGLGVAGVEVQAVRAGDQREGLVEVGAQFVGRAGLAGIVARDRQAAADRLAGVLEAADVVALPAVERDGDARQPRQGELGVHAERRVAIAGVYVGSLDLGLAGVGRHRAGVHVVGW